MKHLSAPILLCIEELRRYATLYGKAPMRSEYVKLSRLGDTRQFRFCAVDHLTRAFGKKYAEIIQDLGLELAESTKIKNSSIETTLEELSRFFGVYGRMPYSDEYDKFSRAGVDREYLFCSISVFKKSANCVSSYYDALRHHGLPVPNVKEHGVALEGKLDSLGLDIEREFSIKTPSGLKKIDARIIIDGVSVYLEVDGNYHHNILSWYHRQKFKGATQIQSFYFSVCRDLEVEQYCAEKKMPLLRVDYELFIQSRKEEIIDLLKMAKKSGFHRHWKKPDPEIVGAVLSFLKDSPNASRAEVARKTGILDLRLVEYEILGYIPQITKNPSWSSL